MRGVKFNKYERVAGAFVLIALVGVGGIAVSAAVRQGWFEPRIHYTAHFTSADGLHDGTEVQISGLHAGAVDSVDLDKNNDVVVDFYIFAKFKDRLRQDSSVQLIRPFIIGERVLDISSGSASAALLAQGSVVPTMESMDLMTLVSGRNMDTYIRKMSGLVENMQILAEAFTDKKRAQSLVRTMDRMEPLIKNLNSMSVEVMKLSGQATHDNGVQNLVANLTVTTQEMNHILPELNRQNPNLAKDLASMSQNLAVVTQTLTPALQEVGPELPAASRRLIEALNQTVVTLKAMQKSMFMRSNVEEVLHDESTNQRLPASK